jgi:hypothetical protein
MERRRASLDVNVGALYAKPNALFANAEQIRMRMLSASFSIHVWGPLEVGAGVGNSWFSSDGFESFSKVIVEPVRFDVRPLRWDINAWRNGTDHWLREMLVLRGGFVTFPAGFSAAELKGEPLGREFVFYKGIFVDTEPLVRKLLGKW